MVSGGTSVAPLCIETGERPVTEAPELVSNGMRQHFRHRGAPLSGLDHDRCGLDARSKQPPPSCCNRKKEHCSRSDLVPMPALRPTDWALARWRGFSGEA